MTLLPASHTTSNGPRRSTPIPYTKVKIEDLFWSPRIQTVHEQTLPIMHTQMKRANYFDTTERHWHKGMHPTPHVFWESDIAKWLEAASYSLAIRPNEQLEQLVDETIAFLASIQQADGYLNYWFINIEPEKRWTNLRDWHELYCAGHLIEAAVAHFKATGKRSLLDIMIRYVDYIESVFGREEGKLRGYDGHEEIELALIKLYRLTGEARYLRLAQYFIEERGQPPIYYDGEANKRGEQLGNYPYEYLQAHQPVNEQQEVVGHAVRAMYLLSAVADLAKELNDPTWQATGERLWRQLTSKRLYITGGIGTSQHNEGFTSDYDLPNDTAYAETCAAIGLVLWNHRLLQLDADGRYADLLERALYNGALSGLSLDGTAFFYVNPLESDGRHHRQGWFQCACCPPNIARLLTSLGEYIYTANESELFIHLYIQGSSEIAVGPHSIKLKQQTRYPWDGSIKIELEVQEPVEFGLNLRIPGWCQNATLTVNGTPISLAEHSIKGYVQLTRRWQTGDEIQLNLAMPIERVYAHPAIKQDADRVALQRGPLVYCLEEADNTTQLPQLRLSRDAILSTHFEPDLLGGINIIEGEASILQEDDWSETLYRTTPPQEKPQKLIAIPYYAWDERTPGAMEVWLYEKP